MTEPDTLDNGGSASRAAAALEHFQGMVAHYRAQDWSGQDIFLHERFDAAGSELRHWAGLAGTQEALPPLAGVTLTVKACFDVAGWPTGCGSKLFSSAPPPSKNASLVNRLLSAGSTVIAQTNMTEFAYGALGVNSHFGTPRTPLDPSGQQVAGGSSSGAAVAVARGYSDIALCSDTSGSARIPAAFCGVVGFKPSRGRYETSGMKWLSTSFDVPGLIATSARMCRDVDAVVAGGAGEGAPRRIRLAIPDWVDRTDIDGEILSAFRDALQVLEGEGIALSRLPLECLKRGSAIAAGGGIIGAEAYSLHAETLARQFDEYDPLVGARILKGRDIPAHRYAGALRRLQECRDAFDAEITGFDGFVLPTVPILPPTVGVLGDLQQYLALNSKSFSFTEFANRLDLPSITLPIGASAMGVMITGVRAGDAPLLDIAIQIEPALAGIQQGIK